DTNINNIHKQMEIYSFSLNLDKNNHVKLKWNKNQDASGYIIYRSVKRNKNYVKIHTIKNPSKNFYTDKKVSPNKKYYYRICAYKLYGKIKYPGRYSSIQSIKTLYLIKPEIKASSGKTASKVRYIQLDLKKYSGTDIAIYIKNNNKKYKRLELTESSIKKYNASFKLRYNSKKKTCCLKVKTFIKKNGKKYYSAFSNIAKVKM
ncbi:MAG: fibronectin type III domain-containing protein, partial [Lachnospiraceae bacterium]|nr:fibronectin type III domain-containing protein [Lachnospiraceae bacterium]